MKRGCTQCGECLNVCPVYALFKREEYAPKGKRLLMEPLDAEYGDAATAQLSWERVRQAGPALRRLRTLSARLRAQALHQ